MPAPEIIHKKVSLASDRTLFGWRDSLIESNCRHPFDPLWLVTIDEEIAKRGLNLPYPIDIASLIWSNRDV